jgi:hypothetical protein
VRRLLLKIALPYLALSLSACRNLPGYTPQSGGEEAAGNHNSTDSSKSTGNIIDACSQITREEVEAAVDSTVKEPTRGDELVSRREGTLTSSCMFASDEGFVSLDIKQQSPASTTAWNPARSYEDLKELLIKGGSEQSTVRFEEVTGLGAQAFAQIREETGNHETTELRILVKRAILTFRVSAEASTSTLEAAKILAGKVLPRLERYDSEAIVATPWIKPKPTVKPDEDKRRTSSKGSETEHKGEKKTERSSTQKAARTAPAKKGREAARRAEERSAKVSQKSSKRTAERGKKETTKTDRTSPKRRKRT